MVHGMGGLQIEQVRSCRDPRPVAIVSLFVEPCAMRGGEFRLSLREAVQIAFDCNSIRPGLEAVSLHFLDRPLG